MALSEIEQNKVAVLIAGTAEIVGQGLNQTAIAIMCEDLAEWEFNDIQAALNACRREVKGRLSLKDIIDRLPKKADELPSADEAWALIADFDNEQKTIIAPAIAFEAGRAGAFNLISTDKVAARMAFKDAYNRLIPNYKGKPIRYEVSLSDEKEERRTALIQAVEDGRITKQLALKYEFDLEFKDEPPLLPNPDIVDEINNLIFQLTLTKKD